MVAGAMLGVARANENEAAEVARSTSAPDAFEQDQRLGRGINVIGYDPI
jgi:hypothetical protein